MSREYCDYILDQLASLRGVSAKRMFGGFGLFKNGLMFGIIIDDILYFKAGDKNRTDYEATGMEPFRYSSKGRTVALSYWQVPAEALDDESALQEWAGKACQAAIEAGDKKPKKKVKTKK